ncbi:MAG: hypothetical protein K0R50_1284 [Eubacterium sp.]|jgi:hypothetical protein|nr:hypothetical protein [Eubacterium sp.]
MKVYEVMNELAKMPAGAKVRINMVKNLKELLHTDDGDRLIIFEVKEVRDEEDYIEIDGWRD